MLSAQHRAQRALGKDSVGAATGVGEFWGLRPLRSPKAFMWRAATWETATEAMSLVPASAPSHRSRDSSEGPAPTTRHRHPRQQILDLRLQFCVPPAPLEDRRAGLVPLAPVFRMVT